MTGKTGNRPMRTLSYADGVITMIDQTKLPQAEEWLSITDVLDLVAAIKRLSVRGAPAIGVAGAYGVAMAARRHNPDTDSAAFEAAVDSIRNARPTAVNLAVMVDRVAPIARVSANDAEAEAHAISNEELVASVSMGELGADFVTSLVDVDRARGIRAMTICNTGGLATVERGTALAVIQTLHERRNLAEAIPVETRPLLQGGRLTTWELQRMGAPFRLVVDSAGPFLLSRGEVDVVLIGADRIAANGDTANKIGSFSLALGAQYAGVPFIVVAPESTVDYRTPTGDDIAIEERSPDEVTGVRGTPIAADGSGARNPAFDVTPHEMITAIVTDKRVVRLAKGEKL